MRDLAARDADLRQLDLIVDMRPTGPAPAPLYPYAEEGESRWKGMALFVASVALGALILLARTAARRPLATLVAIAFAWGAVLVGANLTRQDRPHPSPLFARGESSPETTASLPARAPDPIARLVTQGPAAPAAAPASAPVASPAPQAAAPVQRERRDIVRDVQQELAKHGLYDGTVDGISGPRTERAIRAFETRQRLVQTGQATEELLRHLRAVPAVAAARTAPAASAPPQPAPRPAPRAERSEQDTTRLVQRRLADMGYAPGPIDGQTSPLFRRAVERFQRDNDLPPTGTVDRAFLDRLAVVTGPLS